MSNYDYNEPPAPKKGSSLKLWDILTILTLVTTLCIGVYFILVFVSPNSPLNPLPPNPVDPNAPPTPTITPIQLEPTWTATPFSATETATLVPTITLVPSATPLSLITPSVTPTFTATPKAPFSASVNILQSDITIPHLQSLACNWQGVGGSVVDANNSDIIGMVIRIAGRYSGKTVNMTTVSGVSPDYGKSGFEFVLGTVPIASKDNLYLQLLDQAGLPLAENVYIDTFNECEKNLVLVRFKKNR
ncbi:MAG: hypothetical protein HZB19_13830 [Chloroflexi bacterium]|nr:hypothetical protein [Chloroflexota bacterium]